MAITEHAIRAIRLRTAFASAISISFMEKGIASRVPPNPVRT